MINIFQRNGGDTISSISEKTLELNINENLINEIRRLGSTFSRAFIYGFSLRYEGRWGLDSAINLPGTTGFLMAIQYKKHIPWRSKFVKNIWVFEINNNRNRDQHLKLLVASIVLGHDNIYYAFPLISSSNIHIISPHFLNRIYFVRVIDFPPHTFNFTTHLVYIREHQKQAEVMSREKKTVPLLDAEDLLKRIKFKDVRLHNVKEIKRKISREELKQLLKERGVEEKVIEEFLSRNWKHMFTSGFFA